MTTASQIAALPMKAEADARGVALATPVVRAPLKVRALQGSAWTTAGYVITQALRFASSLVLTRLLAPDVFGLMAMINVFLQGLQMFSDIGIGPSIVHSRRGDHPDFLNTAWTIQAVRGFGLFLVSCAGAWPTAQFFGQPALVYLIPIAGLSAILDGLGSTSLAHLNRQLRLKRVTILEINAQVITYVAIMAWAVNDPSVWALIFGTMVGHVFRTVQSHRLVPGHRNRFHWNDTDARAMIRFGRWIFLSTALTFLAFQTDRIMLGKLLGETALGVYALAIQFATLPVVFIKRIGSQVVFPWLAEVERDRPQHVYRHARAVRLVLVAGGIAVLAPLALLSRPLIQFLYPQAFHDAGWMLGVLAVGAIAGVVNSTYGSALLARGDSFRMMIMLATQVVLLVAMAIIGHVLGGTGGLIIGLASVEWLNYPVTAIIVAGQRLWQPEIDIPALVVAVAIAALML